MSDRLERAAKAIQNEIENYPGNYQTAARAALNVAYAYASSIETGEISTKLGIDCGTVILVSDALLRRRREETQPQPTTVREQIEEILHKFNAGKIYGVQALDAILTITGHGEPQVDGIPASYQPTRSMVGEPPKVEQPAPAPFDPRRKLWHTIREIVFSYKYDSDQTNCDVPTDKIMALFPPPLTRERIQSVIQSHFFGNEHIVAELADELVKLQQGKP